MGLILRGKRREAPAQLYMMICFDLQPTRELEFGGPTVNMNTMRTGSVPSAELSPLSLTLQEEAGDKSGCLAIPRHEPCPTTLACGAYRKLD